MPLQTPSSTVPWPRGSTRGRRARPGVETQVAVEPGRNRTEAKLTSHAHLQVGQSLLVNVQSDPQSVEKISSVFLLGADLHLS